MIHPTTGIYSPSMGQVERATRSAPPTQRPQIEGPGPEGDLLSRDSIRVANISDLANRSVSFKTAISSLDFIEGYLNEIL